MNTCSPCVRGLSWLTALLDPSPILLQHLHSSWDSRPGGWTVPQGMRSIYCPCPRGRRRLSSFHSTPLPLTPRPSRKDQEGAVGMRAPHSAAQTGGPGHEPDLPSSRPPGPCRYLHIHCFLTCLSQQRPTVPYWMPTRVLVPWTSTQPQGAHMLPSEVPAHLKPALRTVVAHAHPNSHPSTS